MGTSEGVDTVFAGLTVAEDASNQVQDLVFGLLDSGFAGVDGLADKVATKMGLSQSSSSKQTAAYEITKIAILGAAELVGIGSTFAKFDATGFTLAQIQKGIKDIQASLDVVLDAPLKLALDYYRRAINQFENGQIQRSIEAVKEMQKHASQAFVYSTGKVTLKNLKDAALAANMDMMAEAMLTSFDGDKIVPFYLLSKGQKNAIVNEMRGQIEKLEDFREKVQKGNWFPLSKKKNTDQQQDALDQVFKVAYPFLSEGQGATSSLTVLKGAITITVLPKYLPDGEEDKTKVMIGREGMKPRAVFLWKKDNAVVLERWQGMKKSVSIPAMTEELQVCVPWLSAAEGVVISGHYMISGQYWRVHTEEGRDAAPVYQRADTMSGEKCYIYRAGNEGLWWAGREVGSEEVKKWAVRSSGGTTSSLPPSSGWEGRNYKEKWESWGDFSVVQGEAEPCAEISLKGNTSENSCYSGTYTPVQGEWRKGYQVFTSSSGFYLYVSYGEWCVGKMVGPGKLEMCEVVAWARNSCPARSIRSDNDNWKWSVQCTSHPAGLSVIST